MSQADFAKDWTPFRDGLMTEFPGLTDAHLAEADGRIDVLATRVAQAEGMDLADAQTAVRAFLAGPMPADAYAAPQHDDAAIKQSQRYVPEGEDPLADDARFGDDDQADRPMGRTG
ncbi:hypothetical protein JANAI62_11420 [Jannaschia pagri]|uniref:Uncharacterized protein n=1 Tax=Jannaschia pagri TaxID=2829797 RepID=A0ABQ4NJD2_9RHOB|nr:MULTISPECIES: hypothetical protein [unclassified Jannaschia]GIT90687.1 hypothetical protein JANAI61_11450 [Jannaschia sp. AI_61]GIT94519.1 hypothetical protein JANAI62_11420 [Jannaschia sp. AI_62]